jgi:hypothetical protein
MSETHNSKKTQSNAGIEMATWKDKFQKFFKRTSDEINRTTAIGKKMLSASQSNTELHDAYETLGQLVEKAIEEGELKWEDPKVARTLNLIKDLKADLARYEEELENIKKS